MFILNNYKNVLFKIQNYYMRPRAVYSGVSDHFDKVISPLYSVQMQ